MRREIERERESMNTKHMFSFSHPQASYLCRQSRPPVVKTNMRRGSADNEFLHTGSHGIDSTRIASRTRHPVPRCLPPTSIGADEENVAP